MSNGSEIKPVETQQADPAGLPPTPPPLTMAQHNSKVVEIRGNMAADAEKKRKLQNALADIEEKLAELGWTVHL